MFLNVYYIYSIRSCSSSIILHSRIVFTVRLARGRNMYTSEMAHALWWNWYLWRFRFPRLTNSRFYPKLSLSVCPGSANLFGIIQTTPLPAHEGVRMKQTTVVESNQIIILDCSLSNPVLKHRLTAHWRPLPIFLLFQKYMRPYSRI